MKRLIRNSLVALNNRLFLLSMIPFSWQVFLRMLNISHQKIISNPEKNSQTASLEYSCIGVFIACLVKGNGI